MNLAADSKKHPFFLMVFFVFLFLIGAIFVFNYWQNIIGSEEKNAPSGENAEVSEEISQEEAINLALEKYPGEIKNIVKPETISERNIPGLSFWLIEIALEEPMFFEKIDKEIKIIKVKVTMDKNIDIYELVE